MPTRCRFWCILLIALSMTGMKNIAVSEEEAVKENDASLRALSVSRGEMVPQFSPGRTRVAVRVPHTISTIEITAAATDSQASISINGAAPQIGSGCTAQSTFCDLALQSNSNGFTKVQVSADIYEMPGHTLVTSAQVTARAPCTTVKTGNHPTSC